MRYHQTAIKKSLALRLFCITLDDCRNIVGGRVGTGFVATVQKILDITEIKILEITELKILEITELKTLDRSDTYACRNGSHHLKLCECERENVEVLILLAEHYSSAAVVLPSYTS